MKLTAVNELKFTRNSTSQEHMTCIIKNNNNILHYMSLLFISYNQQIIFFLIFILIFENVFCKWERGKWVKKSEKRQRSLIFESRTFDHANRAYRLIWDLLFLHLGKERRISRTWWNSQIVRLSDSDIYFECTAVLAGSQSGCHCCSF